MVQIWSTIASAAATVAVAAFAAVELWRERRASQRRELAARVRISATAFLLRDRLRRWLLEPGALPTEKPNPEQLDDWVRYARKAQTLESELCAATQMLTAMVELTGDAPSELAGHVRLAFVAFEQAARNLRILSERDDPNHVEIFDWIDARDAAHHGIKECLGALEGHLIETPLLTEERALQAAVGEGSMDRLLRDVADEALKDDGAEDEDNEDDEDDQRSK